MLAVTAEAIKVGARAITKLSSLEWAKIQLETMTKHLRGFLWSKMLIIDCETSHKSVGVEFMTVFGQSQFLECFYSDSPITSYV